MTPKKTREIELKTFIAESVKVFEVEDCLKIKFGLKITPEGTVKPIEILNVLRDECGLKIDTLNARINRTALLSRGKNLAM